MMLNRAGFIIFYLAIIVFTIDSGCVSAQPPYLETDAKRNVVKILNSSNFSFKLYEFNQKEIELHGQAAVGQQWDLTAKALENEYPLTNKPTIIIVRENQIPVCFYLLMNAALSNCRGNSDFSRDLVELYQFLESVVDNKTKSDDQGSLKQLKDRFSDPFLDGNPELARLLKSLLAATPQPTTDIGDTESTPGATENQNDNNDPTETIAEEKKSFDEYSLPAALFIMAAMLAAIYLVFPAFRKPVKKTYQSKLAKQNTNPMPQRKDHRRQPNNPTFNPTGSDELLDINYLQPNDEADKTLLNQIDDGNEWVDTTLKTNQPTRLQQTNPVPESTPNQRQSDDVLIQTVEMEQATQNELEVALEPFKEELADIRQLLLTQSAEIQRLSNKIETDAVEKIQYHFDAKLESFINRLSRPINKTATPTHGPQKKTAPIQRHHPIHDLIMLLHSIIKQHAELDTFESDLRPILQTLATIEKMNLPQEDGRWLALKDSGLKLLTELFSTEFLDYISEKHQQQTVLVLKKLETALMETNLGAQFQSFYHESVGSQFSQQFSPNSIVEIQQAGLKNLNGGVIQKAKVVLSEA